MRALSQRRLTEAQLYSRLRQRGFGDEEVCAAVERCRAGGYLDDRLYASLYVAGHRKAVGDARLVAELVQRGIEREAASASVAAGDDDEERRIERAVEQLYARRPGLAYPSAARSLERLGFPATLIYRHLRRRAAPVFEAEDSLAAHA